MEASSIDGLTSIIHLPDDCLSNIFQLLNSSIDRESFGLTCRRWLHIQNISRQSLQFQCSLTLLNLSSSSQTNLVVNSYNLQRLLTRFQNLQKLSLSGCTGLPDSGLALLELYGSKLRSLNLDLCFGITDDGLLVVAKGCPHLVIISLYRCNITDVGLEYLSRGCKALKLVNLAHCRLISDRGLHALTQACSQLKAVKIASCGEVTGVGFRGSSSTLALVDAESCSLKPEGIAGIVSGGGLEYLNLTCLSWLITGGGLAAIGSGFAARLKVLNLRMCRTVGNESVIAIAKGCPLLQEWNLALCHEVTISGWKSIGTNCHRLEKLHVNRCRNLCDRGLQALREGCKRLAVLYISQTHRLSPIAIELFKLHRGGVEIKTEEIIYIGPDWDSGVLTGLT